MQVLQNLIEICKEIVMLLSNALMIIGYLGCIALVIMVVCSFIVDLARKIMNDE